MIERFFRPKDKTADKSKIFAQYLELRKTELKSGG
jgi:hypothetical protein